MREPLSRDGFAFIREHSPSSQTLEIASHIGTPATLAGVDVVQVLRPRERSEAPPNIYSGNFGLGRFPLHTDLAHWFVPPRYFLLRCIQGSAEVKTELVDSSAIVADIGGSSLRRALMQPRRAVAGQRPLLPILQACENATIFRWDKVFVRPATTYSEQLARKLEDRLQLAEPATVTLLNKGDTLVVDNWRMLHGRSEVPGHQSARHIERVYLMELR